MSAGCRAFGWRAQERRSGEGGVQEREEEMLCALLASCAGCGAK